MDVDDEVRANVRRRIFSVMNKTRYEFPSSPLFEEFIENREDIIRRFLDLHSSQTIPEAAALREELNRELAAYEAANEEQIMASRSLEDDRKREKIKEVVRQEGLFYERINADYAHRDKVLSHPLEAQFSAFLAHSIESQKLQGGSSKEKRKTRLIPSGAVDVLPVSEPIASTLGASGTVGLWKNKAKCALVHAMESLTI